MSQPATDKAEIDSLISALGSTEIGPAAAKAPGSSGMSHSIEHPDGASVKGDTASLQPASTLTIAQKGVGGKPDVYVIDTPTAIVAMIERLATQAKSLTMPLLYIDLEGINLGRKGTISILQLHLPPSNEVYLVDVFTLQGAAFDTPCATVDAADRTLRLILDGEHFIKVFYDLRSDNDALYNLYHIKLSNARDLQVMEMATRSPGWDRNNRFVSGLAKSLKAHAGLDWAEQREFDEIKAAGTSLFAPEKGGAYQVFNRRPMPKAIIDYCAGDVILLPRLYARYDARITPEWRTRVINETAQRITLARTHYFNAGSRDNAKKPVGW